MESAKGIGRIIDAFQLINDFSQIGHLYFVGDGPGICEFKNQANKIDHDHISFLRTLNRKELNHIYSKCHIILLPTSASEGFPKVLAEGMANGCVPIVSNVGCIKQYIDENNGIILNTLDPACLKESIKFVLSNRGLLKQKANTGIGLAKSFTYEKYNTKIVRMIT